MADNYDFLPVTFMGPEGKALFEGVRSLIAAAAETSGQPCGGDDVDCVLIVPTSAPGGADSIYTLHSIVLPLRDVQSLRFCRYRTSFRIDNGRRGLRSAMMVPY